MYFAEVVILFPEVIPCKDIPNEGKKKILVISSFNLKGTSEPKKDQFHMNAEAISSSSFTDLPLISAAIYKYHFGRSTKSIS